VILDGWSIPIVLADLFAHYRAALTHTRVAAPPPRPFRDYIAWLDRQDPGRARDFWQRTFAGWTGALTGPNPSGASEDRGEATRAIACGDLVALSRRLRLTLNTLAQGAWALVLGRRAGSRDVVFGVTSAGRPYDLDGADRMVGPFISTLPFRATLSAGQPVDAWLRGVQERQVEMRQFEYCPLAEVQSWTGARGPGQLFEALIVFENYPVDALLTAELGTFGVSDVRFTAANHYALTLRVVPRPDRLLLTLLYDRARVSDTQAARILQDLEAALSAIARSGDGDLGSLEQMIVWASPSPEEIETGARHSAEAMLSASRRRVVQS
jgi:non-ribosomal peptide synthetase component F